MNLIRKIINTPKFIINSLKIYKQARKKIKQPFLFFINLYWYKLFKKNLIKNIETTENLKYFLVDYTDLCLIIEYLDNYYNIDQLQKKEYSIIIDIGANAGDFSIFLSKNAKKIYSLEPITEIYNKLKNNLDLNNINHIKVYNYGISDKEQKLKLQINNLDSTGDAKVSEIGNYEIKTISWSKLFELIGKPKRIDLLKIDCEGSEYSLLLDNKILDFVSEICIEIHVFEEKDKEKAANLINLFYSKKFNLIRTQQMDLNKLGAYELYFSKVRL